MGVSAHTRRGQYNFSGRMSLFLEAEYCTAL
jgi:hypothetical protein